MTFFQLSLLRLLFFSIHFLVNPFDFFIHFQFLSFSFSFITFSFRLSLRTSMICHLSKALLVLPWNYTKQTQFDVKSQFKNKELDTPVTEFSLSRDLTRTFIIISPSLNYAFLQTLIEFLLSSLLSFFTFAFFFNSTRDCSVATPWLLPSISANAILKI